MKSTWFAHFCIVKLGQCSYFISFDSEITNIYRESRFRAGDMMSVSGIFNI